MSTKIMAVTRSRIRLRRPVGTAGYYRGTSYKALVCQLHFSQLCSAPTSVFDSAGMDRLTT